MASFDPTTMATQLATAYTQPTQTLLDTQSKTASGTSTALTKLQSALSAFNSAMSTLTAKKGVVQNSAAFGNTATGSAVASASAVPGNYPIFVEQLASKNQVAYNDLPAVPAWPSGPVNMTLSLANGSSFVVDLANADSDSNGTLSQAEIARAINQATGNNGLMTAQVVSSGGQTQLTLSSSVSGAAGKITLDTSALPSGALRTGLEDPAKQLELAAARDAIVWMGPQGTGMKIQQGSNELTAIPGVTVTLKGLSGGTPDTLTIARDDGGTASNLKSFVDAYNSLETALDTLTAASKDGSAGGAFATDAGVRSLRSQLTTLLRQSVSGLSLRDLGVNADRYGQLSLDSGKLSKTLSTQPGAVDQVMGSNALGVSSGVMGSLSRVLDRWTNSASGQIKQRQNTVQSQQKAISDRQTRLDQQYTQSYNRYLKQFSALQQLQSQMDGTTSMLSALST
ncbi:MAG: lateral flagellar hook-associated protein 2 [Methylibium sp.]|nr:lateral flagellar hook-associated protein 2 [Methylibium sp.]